MKEIQAKTMGRVYPACVDAQLDNGRGFRIDHSRSCILLRDCIDDCIVQQIGVTGLAQNRDTTHRMRPIEIFVVILTRHKYCRNIST